MTKTEIYKYKKELIKELIEIRSHHTGGQVSPLEAEDEIIKQVMSMSDASIEDVAYCNTPESYAQLLTM